MSEAVAAADMAPQWLSAGAFPIATPMEAAPEPSATAEPTALSSPTAAEPSAPGFVASRPAARAQGDRIRVPAVGINAPVTAIGVTASAEMEVPADANTIGWYRFTAEPGAPGNALVAGHVDWIDRAAVFYHIRSLKVGDVITFATAGGEFTYVVERSYSVPYDVEDVTPIVGTRSGRSTLTLITCTGTYNRGLHQYEQRLVVVAALRGV